MPETNTPILLLDQRLALYAYRCVKQLGEGRRKDYKIAVNDLGANLLRSGFCAAVAAVQRLGERGELLLGHLAGAGVPGLEGTDARTLAERLGNLDADGYMLATREALRVAIWLKRATQAGATEAG